MPATVPMMHRRIVAVLLSVFTIDIALVPRRLTSSRPPIAVFPWLALWLTSQPPRGAGSREIAPRIHRASPQTGPTVPESGTRSGPRRPALGRSVMG